MVQKRIVQIIVSGILFVLGLRTGIGRICGGGGLSGMEIMLRKILHVDCRHGRCKRDTGIRIRNYGLQKNASLKLSPGSFAEEPCWLHEKHH